MDLADRYRLPSASAEGFGRAVCEKCKGTKRIKSSDGSISACWDCLLNGEMDQHSKNVKDSGIKI